MSEKEIIVPIEGYEKIKVKGCKHKHPVFVYNKDGNWVYCEDCGLRTPVTDQVDVIVTDSPILLSTIYNKNRETA